jgi:excinuclease UvrABC nuclease subunit
MKSGIYVLKTEKHFYIGLSSNLQNRKREHFNNLKKNKHPNNRVQRVYNKGYKFEFEVLENVEVAELDNKEI